MSTGKITSTKRKMTAAVAPSGSGHFAIDLHLKYGASYDLRDSVHRPFGTAVVPDAILNPSVADYPHHRDAIADPDFD